MLSEPRDPAAQETPPPPAMPADAGEVSPDAQEEVGGRGGLDPVRYGDWEKNGRCIDF